MVRIVQKPGAGGGGGAVTIVGDPPISAVETAPGVWEISYADLQELTSFTNDVNTALEGSTVNDINFAWTYNRAPDPTSQSIDQGIGALAVNLRAYNLGPAAGVIADTTWTISAVGDDTNPSSLQTSIDFRPAYYFGVDQAVIATGAGIQADPEIYGSETLGTARQRTYTFDASVGGGSNYLYIVYPQAWGIPASTTFNGFAFNDYTTVQNEPITNSAGFARDYIILRTNNTYGGSDIEWRIF